MICMYEGALDQSPQQQGRDQGESEMNDPCSSSLSLHLCVRSDVCVCVCVCVCLLYIRSASTIPVTISPHVLALQIDSKSDEPGGKYRPGRKEWDGLADCPLSPGSGYLT